MTVWTKTLAGYFDQGVDDDGDHDGVDDVDDDDVDGGDDDGDDGDPFTIVTDGNTGWLCRCCRGAFPHRILLPTVSPAC